MEALHVGNGLHEAMKPCCQSPGAIGFPQFRALVLNFFYLVGGAGLGEMQTTDRLIHGHCHDLLPAWNPANAMFVHTPCSKFVFTVVPEMSMRSVRDGQLSLARVKVVEECAECIPRNDLQTAVE